MTRTRDLQRRPKTSSERGRAFRERERLRLEGLERDIVELNREIAEKTFLRSIWQAKYLRSRHTKFGSLSRVVEQYYDVVRYGVHEKSSPGNKIRNGADVDPVEYLARVTHPNAILGDVVGPEGMIEQWKIYTAAHGRYEIRLSNVDVRGPDEEPVVFGELAVSARLTRRTFATLFPVALNDETLLQQFIGRPIFYRGTTIVWISNEMQIVKQEVHFDFVEALMTAGFRIDQVERLLGDSRITSACTVLDQAPSSTAKRDMNESWKF